MPVGTHFEEPVTSVQRMWVPIATAGALLCASGCKSVAKDDASTATIASALAASSTAVTAQSPPKESHYTRFKVTSAKPSDVENAMQLGWKFVNCSVARGGSSIGGMRNEVYTIEHCYFEGDDHVRDGDAGASPFGG